MSELNEMFDENRLHSIALPFLSPYRIFVSFSLPFNALMVTSSWVLDLKEVHPNSFSIAVSPQSELKDENQ